MKIYFKLLHLTLFAFILSAVNVTAANALIFSNDPHQQPRLPVKISGSCSNLFNGGRQINLGSRDLNCIASVNTATPGFSGQVSLIVTRRLVKSRRNSANQAPLTRRRIYTQNYAKSDQKISFNFLLRSASANVRYTVRAFTASVGYNDDVQTQCEDTFNEFAEESLLIRSCTKDSDCGQPLVGTSCGCTREHVARKNASTTSFYEILARAQSSNCLDVLPITSPCDCPSVSGSYCNAGICDWKYVAS